MEDSVFNRPVTETFTEDEFITVMLGLDTLIKVLEVRKVHQDPRMRLNSDELQVLEESKTLHAKLKTKHL